MLPAVLVILRGPAQVIPGTLGTDTTQVGAVCLDAFVSTRSCLERTKEPEFLQPTSGPRSPPIFACPYLLGLNKS